MTLYPDSKITISLDDGVWAVQVDGEHVGWAKLGNVHVDLLAGSMDEDYCRVEREVELLMQAAKISPVNSSI